MRWGFEGMLQVQFKGNMYQVNLGNFTFDIDGVHVSSEDGAVALPVVYSDDDQLTLSPLFFFFVFEVVGALNMNQYPLYLCYLVLVAVCLSFMLLYYLSLRFIKQKSSQDW